MKAPPELLTEAGCTQSEALLLSSLSGIYLSFGKGERTAPQYIRSYDDAAAFAVRLYLSSVTEQVFLLCLSGTLRLLECVPLGSGTQDRAPAYIRSVLSHASRSSCRYLIICHNHPGGNRMPSREDLELTLSIMTALHPMGIPVLEHIIVSGRQTTGVRKDGYLSNELFIAQGVLPSGWQ